MPRLSSIQKPTTLLTIKKSKIQSNTYTGARRGEIILITDNGIITGDMRVATAKTGVNDDKNISIYQTGAIIYFAGPNPPDGYLVCNGQRYDRDLYPELANYLEQITVTPQYADSVYRNVNGTTDSVGIMYPYFDVISGTWKEYFRVPDFTNPTNPTQGGLFIRNLNEDVPTLPDYNEAFREADDRGSLNHILQRVNGGGRTFGSSQDEMFGWHTHDFTTANTGPTGEDHVHHYYGARGATNGHQLGYTAKGSSTEYVMMSQYDYDTTDRDSSSELYDSEGLVGTHLHAGFLGLGSSFTDPDHNTYHYTDSNFDNVTETKPKNYSVLFCIKY